MSVESILQAMADARASQIQRSGAIWGQTVAGLSQVPAQIIEDRQRRALLARQQAMQDQQFGFQRDANSRANADQALQDRTAADEVQKQALLKGAIAAGWAGDDTHPANLDVGKAVKFLVDAGHPELAPTITQFHDQLLPKLTDFDPTHGSQDAAGNVVRQPVAKPVPPTVASLDAEQQRILAIPEAQRTPAEVASARAYVERRTTPATAQTHNMRLAGVGDVPVDYVPNKDGTGGSWMYMGQDVSGKVTAIPSAAQVTVNNRGAAPPGDWSKTGEEFLQTIPIQWRATVKKVAFYDEDPTKVASMRGGMRETLSQWINQVNPDYQSDQFSVRAPTRKAYTIGTQGQQLTAMNTAIEHLDQLQAAADALENGNFKPGNAAYNYLKDMFGSGAPTSFATIKEKVDKELDAVASKGVPTVSGAAAQKEIGGAISSPAAIKTYIDTSIRLLASSQNALAAPYKRAMGANAPFDPLTPQAKAILTKRGFDPSGHGDASSQTADTIGAVEGAVKPIPGFPGMEQTFKNGKWVRTK